MEFYRDRMTDHNKLYKYLESYYQRNNSLNMALYFLDLNLEEVSSHEFAYCMEDWIDNNERKLNQILDTCCDYAIDFDDESDISSFQKELSVEFMRCLHILEEYNVHREDSYRKLLGRKLKKGEKETIDKYDYFRLITFFRWIDKIAPCYEYGFENYCHIHGYIIGYICHIVIKGQELVKRVGIDDYIEVFQAVQSAFKLSDNHFDNYIEDFEYILENDKSKS